MNDRVIKIITNNEIEKIKKTLVEFNHKAKIAKKEYQKNDSNLYYEMATSIYSYYDNSTSLNMLKDVLDILEISFMYDIFLNEFHIDKGLQYFFTESMKKSLEGMLKRNKQKCIDNLKCYNMSANSEAMAYHKRITETMDFNVVVLSILEVIGFTFDMGNCQIQHIKADEKKVVNEKINMLKSARGLVRETAIGKMKGYYNYLTALENVELSSHSSADISRETKILSMIPIRENDVTKEKRGIKVLADKKKLYVQADAKDRKATYDMMRHFKCFDDIINSDQTKESQIDQIRNYM